MASSICPSRAAKLLRENRRPVDEQTAGDGGRRQRDRICRSVRADRVVELIVCNVPRNPTCQCRERAEPRRVRGIERAGAKNKSARHRPQRGIAVDRYRAALDRQFEDGRDVIRGAGAEDDRAIAGIGPNAKVAGGIAAVGRADRHIHDHAKAETERAQAVVLALLRPSRSGIPPGSNFKFW
jgi:hypothetical protein